MYADIGEYNTLKKLVITSCNHIFNPIQLITKKFKRRFVNSLIT